MKKEDKREYFIVDKRILPNSIKNVIKVNELLLEKNISKYEAIKKVGLSRSTYYKYKDLIKPFFMGGREKVFNVNMTIKDRHGILSEILDIIANEGMNLLTIIQNIAVDGIAKTTLSIQTDKNTLRKIENMLEKISKVSGVIDIRIIGSN